MGFINCENGHQPNFLRIVCHYYFHIVLKTYCVSVSFFIWFVLSFSFGFKNPHKLCGVEDEEDQQCERALNGLNSPPFPLICKSMNANAVRRREQAFVFCVVKSKSSLGFAGLIFLPKR